MITYSRVNSLGNLYWSMAEKAYRNVLIARKKLMQNVQNMEQGQFHVLSKNIQENGIIVIIFSALCLEAEAYDYAAIHLGDSYAKKYLDKLDPVAKWILIPRLIVGTGFKPDGIAISALTRLIKSRNSLVHSKSKAFDPDEYTAEQISLNDKLANEEIDNAYSAIIYMALECDMVLKNQNLGLTLRGIRYPARHKKIQEAITLLKSSFDKSLKQ